MKQTELLYALCLLKKARVMVLNLFENEDIVTRETNLLYLKVSENQMWNNIHLNNTLWLANGSTQLHCRRLSSYIKTCAQWREEHMYLRRWLTISRLWGFNRIFECTNVLRSRCYAKADSQTGMTHGGGRPILQNQIEKNELFESS